MGLTELLADFPAIDQHAHNLLKPEEAAGSVYSAAFTEGYHPVVESQQAPHSLFYLRSLKDMAALLECEPHQVVQRRQQLGFEELTRRCLRASHLECVYLDDGLMPGRILNLDWHRQYVACERLLRLEWLAEQCLAESQDAEQFQALWEEQLNNTPCIGFKSIAAYRSGLELDPEAAWHWGMARAQNRLTHKASVDWLVNSALRRGKPVQFHCGFGDPDLDLRQANPLLLRAAIEKHPQTPFVLLHGAYPFVREAGFLASVYPNVYLDLGLAVPFLSVQGMRAVFRMAFELVPLTKLLWSSDASRIPDLYYLGSLWGRRLLGEALERCVADGELSWSEAESYGRAILRHNAERLYSSS